MAPFLLLIDRAQIFDPINLLSFCSAIILPGLKGIAERRRQITNC